MKTVQVVLDARLLQAVDRAAQRTKQTRSALIRDALRQHLRKLEVRALEELAPAGYSRRSPSSDGALAWEAEAAWPAE